MTKKFGDPNKTPASGASSMEHQPNMLISIINDQKKFYEYSRVIWSSAQIMQHMIMSQMSHTKLNMKMLMTKFTKPNKPVTDIVLQFLLPFYHLFEQKKLQV